MHKLFLYSTIIIIFYSCAKPVTPTGGERDAMPPIIIESNIPQKTTSIKPNKISFTFDENIQIKSPEKTINISPIPNFKVTYRKHNKGIDILLDSSLLQDNTTYSIQLNNSISDLNEGNVGQYPAFIFSTGKAIDSLNLTTYINNYSNYTKPNLKAYCYITNQPNTRFTALAQKASFDFEALPSGDKQIIIYNDENNNNNIDESESIAYSILTSEPADSVGMYLYNRKKYVIKSIEHSSAVYVYGLPKSLIGSINYNHIGDTLILNSSQKDSILSSLDSNHFIISKIVDKPASYVSFITQENPFDSLHTLSIISNQNDIIITPDSVQIIYNSGRKETYKEIITTSVNKATLTLPDSALKVIIKSNGIKSSNFSNKSTLSYTFQKKCKLSITNPFDTQVIGEIQSPDNKISVTINPNSTIDMYVSQGTYKGYFFQDQNQDKLITAPNINKTLLGENVIWIKEIVTKTNLDSEIILK